MKVAILFLCLALAVALGYGYDVEEELEEYMLEDMIGDADLEMDDVELQNWFTNVANKAKSVAKKVGGGIKKAAKGLQKAAEIGCGVINQIPSRELEFRLSMAFPELVSEDGYAETADVKKIANGARDVCRMID